MDGITGRGKLVEASSTDTVPKMEINNRSNLVFIK